jgi:hypothetical protein
MQSHKSKDPKGYSRKARGNGGEPLQYQSLVRSLLGFAPSAGVGKGQRRTPPVGFPYLDQQVVTGNPFDRIFPAGLDFASAEDQPWGKNAEYLETYSLTSTEGQQPEMLPDPSEPADIQLEMVDRFDHSPKVHQARSNGSAELPVQNKERPEPFKVELTADDLAEAANLDIPGVSDQPIEFPNLKDPEMALPPSELKSSNFSENIATDEQKSNDHVKTLKQTAIVVSRPEEFEKRHTLRTYPPSSNSSPDLGDPEKPSIHFEGLLSVKQPDGESLHPSQNFPTLRTVATFAEGQINHKSKGQLPKAAEKDTSVSMASSSKSAGEQIDQLRRAVHNLSKKTATLKSAFVTRNDQQESESPRAETIQPVIIVNKSASRFKKTPAFWERSYLRRSQLHPLR